MTLARIASGTAVFVDANIFVYLFGPDPRFGPACEQLLDRIELHDLQGFTTSHVLADVAHRLMSLEACAAFGWPYAGIAARMQGHPADVRRLTRFRQAVEAISQMGVQVIPVFARHVVAATAVSQDLGLLTNDALIVAVMRENGLAQIASNDADFDRVVGVTRFGPAESQIL